MVPTPIPLNSRTSSSSGLSVSSLLSSLSSDVKSVSALTHSNLPLVDDNDFYAVITGLEPGVWQGRYIICLYAILGLICVYVVSTLFNERVVVMAGVFELRRVLRQPSFLQMRTWRVTSKSFNFLTRLVVVYALL